jgi:hypothetical protein
MARFTIIKSFQLFFRLLLIFSLVFIWVRYYTADLKFSVWISLLITLSIELILKLLKQKKEIKTQLGKQETAKAEKAINNLILNTKAQNINFFFQTFQKSQSTTKHKHCVIVENNEKEKLAIVPYFIYSKFSIDNLIEVLQNVKSLKPNKIIVCTNTALPATHSLAKAHKTPVIILEKDAVYFKVLKKYDSFPQQNSELALSVPAMNKLKFKDILKNALDPKRTKSYFLSSIALLFATYFVPYNIYYIVFASILLVLCLASFTSTWWKKIPQQKLF